MQSASAQLGKRPESASISAVVTICAQQKRVKVAAAGTPIHAVGWYSSNWAGYLTGTGTYMRHVKLRPGGQIEVEFIAQALQLVHMPEHPEIHSETTRVALRHLAGAGVLSEAEAGTLIRAALIWRTVQGMLRILLGRGAHKDLSAATARPLLRAVAAIGIQAVDSADLLLKLDEVAREVRAIFVRHVGATEG